MECDLYEEFRVCSYASVVMLSHFWSLLLVPFVCICFITSGVSCLFHLFVYALSLLESLACSICLYMLYHFWSLLLVPFVCIWTHASK